MNGGRETSPGKNAELRAEPVATTRASFGGYWASLSPASLPQETLALRRFAFARFRTAPPASNRRALAVQPHGSATRGHAGRPLTPLPLVRGSLRQGPQKTERRSTAVVHCFHFLFCAHAGRTGFECPPWPSAIPGTRVWVTERSCLRGVPAEPACDEQRALHLRPACVRRARAGAGARQMACRNCARAMTNKILSDALFCVASWRSGVRYPECLAR
jgi:hypothetical protein